MPSRNVRDDTFDAGIFGTLRYDFKKWGGKQASIPDPSDELIEQFAKDMRGIMREFGGEEIDDDATDEEVLEAMADDSRLQIVEAQRAMCGAMANLCQESPSAEELLALPLRVRTSFSQWLQRKLTSPEAEGAGSSTVRSTRSGA